MQRIPLSRIRKVIFILLTTTALFALSTVVLALVLGLIKPYKNEDEQKVCVTKSCIASANMILENIDSSIDPCDDFNQFSCGSFIKNQRIPDDQTSLSSFDFLRNRLAFLVADELSQPVNVDDISATINAKNLYKSCIDEVSMEILSEIKLLNFLQTKFNNWPILNDRNWNETGFDPIDTLVTSRFYGYSQILSLVISSNPKSPRTSILRVRQPNWFFNKQYYDDKIVMNAYKDYMLKFVKFLNSTKNDTELRKEVENILDIEKSFGYLIISDAKRRNSVYINTTVKDLMKDLPNFDWKLYIIDGVFKNIENVTITENEPILVDDLSYLKNATELYAKYAATQKRDLKNFLLWVFVKDKSFILPKKYTEARLEFDKIYRGAGSSQPRSLICSNYVIDRMEYAAGRLYVYKYFNNQSKLAATNMIEYIQNEFKNILKNSEWLDSESKAKAFEKADSILSKIGYPEFIFDEREMNKRYADYQFSVNDIFTNTLNSSFFAVKNNLESLRIAQNKTDWITGPAIVNAFYNPINNEIFFPAGILQAPFYDSQVPNYLNFGGIGSVIGHEITHGFDDRGRLYDKDGVYFQDGTGLWSNKTIENYKTKANCIVNQYSNYIAKQVNMSLNGFQTQGENIADNGGIKESFYAYQRWVKDTNKIEPLLPGLKYSQNQLFFINYAQVWCAKFREPILRQRILTGVHSPAEFRILGPTSNFDEFSKAFKCKSGTKNNPSTKCSVW